MLILSEAAITVVGANASETLQGIDEAYVANLRMAADAVEALKKAGLPAIQGQRLVENFNESFDKAATWRRSVTSSIARLQVLHKHSNQAEIDGGCPREWLSEFFVTSGEKPDVQNKAQPRVDA